MAESRGQIGGVPADVTSAGVTNVARPSYELLMNSLLNTAPDLWASLKIMIWLLKPRGWQFASMSLGSDSPKTTIDPYIHFLWNRSVVEVLVSISLHNVPLTQWGVGQCHCPTWFANRRNSDVAALLQSLPTWFGVYTNDLAEAISAMLKERLDFSCKVLYQHFRIAKGTCLWIFHDTLA
jgi:hypothetical protein